LPKKFRRIQKCPASSEWVKPFENQILVATENSFVNIRVPFVCRKPDGATTEEF